MFGKKNKDAVYLTYDEKSILLRALVELKNSLIRDGKYIKAVEGYEETKERSLGR